MKPWLRSLGATWRVRALHRRHRSQAGKALAGLARDGRGLSAADARACAAYAADVLGDPAYAPWLRVYAAFAGGFRPGWIPDNYYRLVVLPRLKGAYGEVADCRALARTLFPTDAMPDVAYLVNGVVWTADKAPLWPAAAADLLAAAAPLLFKPDASQQGIGHVHLDADALRAGVLGRLGNGVIQRLIVQHADLAAFSPAVATLRVTSVVTDAGAVEVRAAYLRLGRMADRHVMARSNLRVALDLADGRFAAEGLLPDLTAVRAHPDSGVRFAGARVPGFGRCLDLVRRLHALTPFARVIGWDLAVDRDGAPRVMEWNGGHNDIKFSEAATGPCFAGLGWERLWREGPPA